MNLGSFFSELKRRNVYKVAITYAVVAWLLIQAASILLPTFEAPAWVMKALVVFLALGFVISVMISWAFEATPQGLKRTEDVPPDVAAALPTWSPRKFAAFVIIVAVIAAGLLAFNLFRNKSAATIRDTASAARTEAATGSIPEKSIAVLPFENLSDEKQNAYFAAGIQDEILTRLAKIGALKVISRSSTQQYQSKPGNLREIARQLGVANILEGSVQKAGSAVHVNVQLIKAATDDHLWAESYDRTLENIFGVEGEIAQTVAEALKAKLSGAEQQLLAQKPTNVPAAYDAYLRGTAIFWQGTAESGRQALNSFEEAARLDPKFAAAWAAVSRTHSLIFFHSDATPARRAAAEKALAEANRLQPDLAETQVAAAYLQYWVLHDYKGALEMMQRLHTAWPNNAEILEVMAFIAARLGQWERSIDLIQQSATLNPRDLYTRIQTISLQLAIRDTDAAVRTCDTALRDWPNDSNLLGLKAQAFQMRGQLDQAQSIVNGLAPNVSVTPLDIGATAIWYQAKVRRNPEIARTLFQSLETVPGVKSPTVLTVLADLQNMFGQKAESQKTFAQARDGLESDLNGQLENGDLVGPLAYVLARLGDREAALRTLEKRSAISRGDARATGVTEDLRARILTYFGDKTGAITSLERIMSAPNDGSSGPPLTPALLRLDPDFDPLRGDPRFEKLVEAKP